MLMWEWQICFFLIDFVTNVNVSLYIYVWNIKNSLWKWAFYFISIVCNKVLKIINQRVNFNEYCDFTQNFGQQNILTVNFFYLVICRFYMQKFNILTLHILDKFHCIINNLYCIFCSVWKTSLIELLNYSVIILCI